jgi:hypothetical protein
MNDRQETFEAFFSKWKNERIQPLGIQGIEPDDRDHVIAERAGELDTLCRERGTHAELVETAKSFGGIENFVRHLIQISDAQGTTLRPTAHDGADD